MIFLKLYYKHFLLLPWASCLYLFIIRMRLIFYLSKNATLLFLCVETNQAHYVHMKRSATTFYSVQSPFTAFPPSQSQVLKIPFECYAILNVPSPCSDCWHLLYSSPNIFLTDISKSTSSVRIIVVSIFLWYEYRFLSQGAFFIYVSICKELELLKTPNFPNSEHRIAII